ncbi:MAG: acyl-CoA thioesterase [Bacteroidetes bacterium]|nr:MAG: acyl-CoA thioesterase [Bacteroidota bacterium]
MIKPLRIQVRFADCDMMGHVNNAIYLQYFELARMHYFNQLVGKQWNWQKEGIVLKVNHIEYHAPLLLEDAPEVYVFLESIGKKSFILAYELRVGEQLKTSGSSVIVCFDYLKQQTVEVYPAMKEALQKLKKAEA